METTVLADVEAIEEITVLLVMGGRGRLDEDIAADADGENRLPGWVNVSDAAHRTKIPVVPIKVTLPPQTTMLESSQS